MDGRTTDEVLINNHNSSLKHSAPEITKSHFNTSFTKLCLNTIVKQKR